MNRQVVVIGLAAAAFAVVAGVIVLRMDAPEPEDPAPVVVAPVEAPASAPAAPAPRPVAPEPRPVPTAPVAPAPSAEAPPVVAAAPTMGLLHIESDVPGAQVFIDRQFIGSAPVVAEDVTPGPHQLNVSAQGFDNVVHKHRFGSCDGRLVATPQGLRYETSNQNDGFTTPLLDLETFEVDYLDKNLRVRLSGGRQLNFTDPDGDADRLFVFHRDVENARERLSRGDAPATD